MKVGLVGVGYWGTNHLRTLRRLQGEGRLDGVVVADADAARAQAAAKQAGCDAAPSVEALLRDASVEAVDLVTPTPTHFDLAKTALLAGKHVLVEKPMTERSADARELLAVAERARRLLMPGHLFRYHPGVEAIAAMVREGALGEVRYLEASRKAHRAPRPDMGVVAALGVHELDLSCWLLGRDLPDTVHCELAGWHHEGIEEVAWITLRFGDVRAHAVESWASPWAGKERRLAVFGERAAVLLDDQRPGQLHVDDYAYEAGAGGWALRSEGSRTVPVPMKEPLAAELEDFLRCAATGATPRADMASGARAVRMVEACFESAREGRTVRLR